MHHQSFPYAAMSSFLPTQYPLLQAPMAGAQDQRLAVAVGRAGGLGSLPAAMLSADALQVALTELRDSGLPHNVNFFCHTQPHADTEALARWRACLAPYAQALGLNQSAAAGGGSRRPFDDEMAEVLEDFPPDVVSFHFGLPEARLLARVRARGSRVLSSATTLREALWLQAHGADAVIAQGLEAGGHRGHFLDTDPGQQHPTLSLLPMLVEALDVPVIAAGGIGTADDVQQAMALGAEAVQVGTAFLCCDEAKTGALHRARLMDLDAPTALTNLFSGGLARGLFNRLIREQGPVSPHAPPFPLASADLAPLRAAAEAQGLDDFTPLWSGTNRRGCIAAPAAEVVARLMATTA